MEALFQYGRVVAEIERLGSRRVALQFDAVTLASAPLVVWELSARIPGYAELYVVGDAVADGAVDAVCAAHVDADLIVHYGDECLEAPPERSVPVLFILGEARKSLGDMETTCSAIASRLNDDDAAGDIVVLYSTPWREKAAELGPALAAHVGCTVQVGRMPQHVREEAATTSGGHLLAGLEFPGNFDERALSNVSIVYLGSTKTPRYHSLLLRCAECQCFIGFDPDVTDASETPSMTRPLAKRHHQIHRAANASRWGVVVASAGRVRLAAEVAARCDATLRKAGRSSYVLALGTPTPTKLANFAELEAFVVVGADLDIIEGLQRDCAAALITPNELAVALGKADWLVSTEKQPFYSSELRDALTQLEEEGDEVRPKEDDDDDGPSFDLSSSTLRDTRRRALAYEEEDAEDATAALEQNKELVEWNSAAADFLSQRSWQGLQPEIGKTPVTRALEGRTGVASGYEEEPDDEPNTP